MYFNLLFISADPGSNPELRDPTFLTNYKPCQGKSWI